MTNKKHLIYLATIIIIGGITLYNFITINIDNATAQNKNKIENQRLASLSNLLIKSGKRIEDLKMTDATTLKTSIVSFKDPVLMILLSNFGCSKCQNRELENINKYIKSVANNKIKIIAVGNTNDRDILLKLKKVTQINIPMYYNNISTFIDTYKIDDKFPQYIYVVNNRVVYSFLPLQDDDKYSEWLFTMLRKTNQYYNE